MAQRITEHHLLHLQRGKANIKEAKPGMFMVSCGDFHSNQFTHADLQDLQVVLEEGLEIISAHIARRSALETADNNTREEI